MTTKDKLLRLLEESRGTFYSGEEIAGKLSVTRTAVWKAVKGLQSDGYPIDGIPNKGYCLSPHADILSGEGIRKYLDNGIPGDDITVLPVATSTNALARERAGSGFAEGCLVVANEQTAGRGRMSRRFYSPRGTGIYMSVLLRPVDCKAEQAVRMTTIAAVALCEAIEAVSGEEARIKWVNDIFIGGKKVCGILTEGVFGLESGTLDYAVLGIGINAYPPEGGFPPELDKIAGTVFASPRDDAKNRLVATFLNRFYPYYRASGATGYTEKYRDRSLVIGKRVTLQSAGGVIPATVLGIDDRCRLLVAYDDGTRGCYASGEISVRL